MERFIWMIGIILLTLLGLRTFFPELSPALSASVETTPDTGATYRITFDSTWSNTTHPSPDFPEAALWSDLVGMMHGESVNLWQVGGIATTGMKNVAQYGSIGALRNEVAVMVNEEVADQWIEQPFSMVGGVNVASFEIETSIDYPYLSLAAMLMPSPDWFSGIDSVLLLDDNGVWRDSFSVELYPYDAGTDSGTLYTSENQEMATLAPIADYTGVAPFSAESLGTLTITLLDRPE